MVEMLHGPANPGISFGPKFNRGPQLSPKPLVLLKEYFSISSHFFFCLFLLQKKSNSSYHYSEAPDHSFSLFTRTSSFFQGKMTFKFSRLSGKISQNFLRATLNLSFTCFIFLTVSSSPLNKKHNWHCS